MTDQRLRIARAVPGSSAEERVLNVLAQPHIIIRTVRHPTDDERLAAAMLYSLCCRVFPNTSIDLDGVLPPNPWGVRTVASAVASQPSAQPRSHHTPQQVVIALGRHAGPADLYIAGDDWTAIVSRAPITAQPAPGQHGSLGLHAAAALAASEVFKCALANLGLQTMQLEAEMVWNLVDYRLHKAPPIERNGAAGHQELLFIGAGSLGSSAIAALTLTDIVASIEVIDNDDLDPDHNPFRYPAATTTTTGSKVRWLGAMVGASPSISAQPRHQLLQDWIAQRALPGFDGTAVVTVDRVDARRHAADLSALHTIAAGVNGLATELHRSTATDNTAACSYCLHIDVADPYDQVDVYAELTNLAPDRVRELLNGDRLTRADLAATHVPTGGLTVGDRFEDLVRGAYAEATLPAASDESSPAGIAAPHVSWLTGLTIAAELLKQSLGVPTLDRRLRLDLRGLPLGTTDRPMRDPTGRCLCHNPTRHAAARSWYDRD